MKSVIEFILKYAGQLYWRLKLIRNLGKVYSTTVNRKIQTIEPITTESGLAMHFKQRGKAQLHLPSAHKFSIEQFKHIRTNKPFENVLEASHFDKVIDIALQLFEKKTFLHLLNEHFCGEPYLWNIGLNYSPPSRKLSDSQYWHFDYGDSKQLHCMVYQSDVDEKSGPFTHLSIESSKLVKRSKFFVERLTDEEIFNRYRIDPTTESSKITCKSGDCFIVEPGELMHRGAICEKERLVLFITITTRRPMVKRFKGEMSPLLRDGLFNAYKKTESVNLKRSFFI